MQSTEHTTTDTTAFPAFNQVESPIPFRELKLFHHLYFVICLIAAVSAISMYQISLFENDERSVSHLHKVRDVLDALLLTTIDAEIAYRNGIAAGHQIIPESHLKPEHDIDEQLDQLKLLVSDDPIQSQYAMELATLIARQIEMSRVRKEEIRTHDAIRHVMQKIRDSETIWLKEKQNQSESTARLARTAIVLATFFLIGIATIADVLIRRNFANRHHAYTVLQEAHTQLQLLDAAFRNVQESIVITTLDCRIIDVNPAFSIVTEYSHEEVIGKHIRILQSGQHDSIFYQKMWQSILTTGHWQGEIWNRRQCGDIYQAWLSISTIRNAEGEPAYYIGVSTDLNRMNHAKTHLEYLAHHDQLTGLPNRLLLYSRLKHTIERAKRDTAMCAVLFLDLDRFKPVNDMLGHAAGDKLLKLAAARMRERLRDIDTLARIGGDEFVVVLEEISSQEDAADIAQALIDQLDRPFLLDNGQQANISVSIGISIYPDNAIYPDALLDSADNALYAAKQSGRGTWQFALSTGIKDNHTKTI